jgi:D-alanyl-D-alanine carboxypeptidase
MAKKLLIIIFIFSLSLLPKEIYAQKQIDSSITAQLFLVSNLSDNSVILDKNKSQQAIPASLVKLMGALVAVENIDLNQTITLRGEMLKPEGWSPSLFPTLRISAENLLKASLIQSSNDAAFALTFFLPKGKFVKLMNEKAKKLGMEKTIFYDATGLSSANKSTAEDMTKLLSYIYQNHPQILEITKDDNFWLPGPDGKLRKFKNMNHFYQRPDFIGGKSGYLKKAGETFASIFVLTPENKPIAIVLFSSKDIKKDVDKIIEWIKKSD